MAEEFKNAEVGAWDARQGFFQTWFNRKSLIDIYAGRNDFDNWINEVHGLLMDFNFLYATEDLIEGKVKALKKAKEQYDIIRRFSGATFQRLAEQRRQTLRMDLRREEGILQRLMWVNNMLIPKQEVIDRDDAAAIIRSFKSQI